MNPTEREKKNVVSLRIFQIIRFAFIVITWVASSLLNFWLKVSLIVVFCLAVDGVKRFSPSTSFRIIWTFSAPFKSIHTILFMVIVSCRKRFHPSNSFHKWLISLRPWRIFFIFFFILVTIEKLMSSYKEISELCSVRPQPKWTLWTLLICRFHQNVLETCEISQTFFGSSKTRLHKMKPIWKDQIDIWMFDIEHFGKLLSLTVIHGRWFWHFICHMSLWYASLKTIFNR